MKTTRAQNFFAAALIGAFAVSGCSTPPTAQTQDDNKPKPATQATKQANAAWLQRLDFANKQDFEYAKQFFIEALPEGGVVKTTRVRSSGTRRNSTSSGQRRQRPIP